MDNGCEPEFPPAIAEDLGSTAAIRNDNHDGSVPPAPSITSSGHSRQPSDPTLLSPGILKPGRRSIDTSADEDEFRVIPPSPTLSTQSSVHFKTSTALRENKPGDGTSSLALLSPGSNSRSHSRRPSNATTTSTEEGTVADHSPGLSHLYPATSNVTTSVRSAVGTLNSPTPTHVGSTSDIGDSEKRNPKPRRTRKKVKGDAEGTPEEGGDDDDDEDKQMELDLTQDENIDPTPFAFKPFHLASLVDPKNLESLEGMGGINGLLAGLGADSANGLSIGGKKSESGDTPAVVVTTPAGEKAAAEGATYASTVEDRQRVYGSNVLPARRSKSLLELMWLALKDKVLVSNQSFRIPGEPAADVRSATDPSVHCCGYFPCSRFLPGLWSRPGTGGTPGRLGRRCCHHRRHFYCRMRFTLIKRLCALTPFSKGDGWLPQRLAKGKTVPNPQRQEGGAWCQGHPVGYRARHRCKGVTCW